MEQLSQLNQITTFQTHGTLLDFRKFADLLMVKRMKADSFALMPSIYVENLLATI